jgi:hypothetical protein
MATKTSSSAVKKPAAKKTVVKKTAAKKPAAKTAAAKKPVAKKPAAKKPAAKTAAAKKPVAKKPAAKKPAAKTSTAKNPAAKKPAAKKDSAKKPAAVKKTATKSPVKKPAAKKPEEIKAATPKAASAEQAPLGNKGVKAMDLFEAYTQNKLPKEQGYIVSSFFSEKSNYTVYEVVSYTGVKEIHPSETGLFFQSSGKKLYILVEPATYSHKAIEPVFRSDSQGEMIPKRFSELETIIAKNQTKIMVAKEPNESMTSFTILKPTGGNFAFVFYNLPEIYENLANFFELSFNKELNIPNSDAKLASKLISNTVEKSMAFKSDFG